MIALIIVQLVERAVLGAFFTITGAHKLFDSQTRTKFKLLFRKLNIPRLWCLVACSELTGGVGILLGANTRAFCLILALILMEAIRLDAWKTEILSRKPKDFSDLIAKGLYCPEVLMVLLLGILLVIGAGPWSVDHWLFGGWLA